VKTLRTAALAAAVLAIAGCSSSNVTPTPPSPASIGAQAAAIGSGFTLALPWDTSASPSHEIMCAYGSEGITATGAAGATDGCKHHANGPSGYTQDGDALDFDLHFGDSVRSIDAGIVRWAKAYAGSSSWSCYGNSIAIDEHLADGSVVTAFYAHLSSIEVSVGDQITAGKEIGKAGATGGDTNGACPSAYGPHLHLALYTNASYTDAKGAAVAAADLPASATGSREPVTSPPYGGTARLPEPWLACSRHSALASPPSGEDASCANLHAGDVLTSITGGTSTASGGAAACSTALPTPRPSLGAGFRIGYETVDAKGYPVNPDSAQLDVMVNIFQARLTAMGLSDAQVTASRGSSSGSPAQIDVVVHESSQDVANIVESLLGQAGRLDFVPLPPQTYGTSGGAAGAKPVPAVGSLIDPTLPAQFTGQQLDPNAIDAHLNSSCSWVVGYAFSGSAGSDLDAWTAQHVNDYLEVVLDGKVLSVSHVEGPLAGRKGEISGNFTATTAKELAAILGSGALPFNAQEDYRLPDTSGGVSFAPSTISCSAPDSLMVILWLPPTANGHTITFKIDGHTVSVAQVNAASGWTSEGGSLVATYLLEEKSVVAQSCAGQDWAMTVGSHTAGLYDSAGNLLGTGSYTVTK